MNEMQKKTIRLFVADVDGTLLNEKSELEKETIEAIRRFQKQGGIFMVATGRNSWELKQITDPIDDAVINCVNGSLLCGEDGKAIFAHFMEKEQIDTVETYCRQYDTPVEYHGEHGTYTTWKKEDFRQRAIPVFRGFRSIDAGLLFDMIYDEHMHYEVPIEEIREKRIAKIEVLFMDEETMKILPGKIRERFPDCNSVSTESMASIEMTSARADKGQAILSYCAMKGIGEDEVVTVGDSSNDISMLKRFKNSYAMANADEETKKAAGHVTLSNREKGVAVLLEKICDENERVQ